MSGRKLQQAIDGLNAGVRPIAEQIESSVMAWRNHGLGIAWAKDRQTSMPDLNAAWESYCALSSSLGELREIRYRMAAARVVRENAALFPAARCANLLERMEDEALEIIQGIVSRAGDAAAGVVFDACAASTLRAQLTALGSPAERISQFQSRAELTAARSLALIAWFTWNTCELEKAAKT